jgi:CRP-like cAMP-binding protein
MTDERESLAIEAARQLTHTTKSKPYMTAVTPQYLLQLLPWENVPGGTFRINRTKMIFKRGDRVEIIKNFSGKNPQVTGEGLRAVPIFNRLNTNQLKKIASRLVLEEHERGVELVHEGTERDKFYIIAEGSLELMAACSHGNDIRLKFLNVGDFFGAEELLTDETSKYTIRTLTKCTLLSLTWKSLDKIITSDPALKKNMEETMALVKKLMSSTTEHGEAVAQVKSGHKGEVSLPSTFVDYSYNPKEIPLSSVQTILKVHTRVSDIYNDPMNQLQEQLRLTIQSMKERQEWEMINNPFFGLINQCEPYMNVHTHFGSPTPDDMDNLLSLVWKSPSFFLAHPLAIAAFGRECTWRGVPPPTVEMFGGKFITWRGIPLIPTDKIEINKGDTPLKSAGTTSIILVRIGKETQGVVGLHQTGIPNEITPGLSVRLMKIDQKAISSYLLTQYYALAAMAEDAIAVLDNVEVGFYHDYANRVPKIK